MGSTLAGRIVRTSPCRTKKPLKARITSGQRVLGQQHKVLLLCVASPEQGSPVQVHGRCMHTSGARHFAESMHPDMPQTASSYSKVLMIETYLGV